MVLTGREDFASLPSRAAGDMQGIWRNIATIRTSQQDDRFISSGFIRWIYVYGV